MTDIDNQKLIKFLLGAMESLSLGILAVNEEGIVFIYNRRMGELEDREPGQVLGKHISSLYESDHPAREMLTALKCGQPVADSCRFIFDEQGREVSLITSIYPLMEQGRVAALVAVTREDNLLAYIMKTELQRPEQPYVHCSNIFPPDTLRTGSPFFPGVSKSAELVREQAAKAAVCFLQVLFPCFCKELCSGPTWEIYG